MCVAIKDYSVIINCIICAKILAKYLWNIFEIYSKVYFRVYLHLVLSCRHRSFAPSVFVVKRITFHRPYLNTGWVLNAKTFLQKRSLFNNYCQRYMYRISIRTSY